MNDIDKSDVINILTITPDDQHQKIELLPLDFILFLKEIQIYFFNVHEFLSVRDVSEFLHGATRFN